MIQKKILRIAFMFFFISSAIFAQDKKIIKRQIKANQEFTDYSFIDAQIEYLKLANSGFRSEDLLKGLGDSYYFTADYENAATWYKELYEYDDFNPEVSVDYLYRYAQSLKSIEKYDQADIVMGKYKMLSGEDMHAPENLRDFRKEIENNSGKYSIENVKFNSSLSDFAPAYWNGRLVFASNRIKGKRADKIHNWNKQPFLDLYSLILDGDAYGTTPNKIKGKINTQYHESTMVYSSNEDALYFTRNNYNKFDYDTDESGTNRLKLYRAKKNKRDKWEIEELPFNSDEYSVAHPALSVDEKTLYFASDMPGGYGNSDLYSVPILEGGFGEITNLGNQINSKGRDTFPFISGENKLYYSSDDRDGLGGLDIYVTDVTQDDNIYQINNLGKPINGPKDDFSFVLAPDLITGFFASNREGGQGFDDIYSFKKLEQIQIKAVCEQTITGVVKDKNKGKPIPKAKVVLINEDNIILSQGLSDVDGIFDLGLIECEKWYRVRATKENHSLAEERFKSTAEPDLALELEMNLTPKVVGPTIAIGEDLSGLLNIKNINFDYDKSFIRSDAAYELDKVITYMKKYPTVKIDVRSHTDARGSDSYNLSLSKRRNASTIDYIINKGGVSRARVTGRGYGETQLINGCANGVKCEDVEHEKNRRSEFIVVQK